MAEGQDRQEDGQGFRPAPGGPVRRDQPPPAADAGIAAAALPNVGKAC